MEEAPRKRRGRGAVTNSAGRFETRRYLPDEESVPEETTPTKLFADSTREIIARNQSPDVGFDASVNPYRGCEHGCAYCFARPTHEYLGFSAGLDFETRIMVKYEAPKLLRESLASPGWKPEPIAMSGVTDAYQPIEKKLRLTRGCLEVLEECGNPVVIITKNELVSRDTDLLASLAERRAALVCLSMTSLDPALTGSMEPRSSRPEGRLRAIEALSAAGVPVGVLVAPIVPAINEHEIPTILQAAASAGATFASYVLLRLPISVGPVFEGWLEANFPDRKEKVLNRVRETRNGKLYEAKFGERMRGRGEWAEQIRSFFHVWRTKVRLEPHGPALSTEAFRRPNLSGQRSLF